MLSTTSEGIKKNFEFIEAKINIMQKQDIAP